MYRTRAKKTKILLLTGVLLTALSLTALAPAVFAAWDNASSYQTAGQPVDNLTWTVYESGLLEISGTGEM